MSANEMTPKQAVLAARPTALCMHVPMSMAVAIYCDGKRIGNAAVDVERAWESAARCLKPNALSSPADEGSPRATNC